MKKFENTHLKRINFKWISPFELNLGPPSFFSKSKNPFFVLFSEDFWVFKSFFFLVTRFQDPLGGEFGHVGKKQEKNIDHIKPLL